MPIFMQEHHLLSHRTPARARICGRTAWLAPLMSVYPAAGSVYHVCYHPVSAAAAPGGSSPCWGSSPLRAVQAAAAGQGVMRPQGEDPIETLELLRGSGTGRE